MFDEQLRCKIQSGIDKMANAVKVTIGPAGRNVILYQKASLQGAEYSDRAAPGAPAIAVNDGVTIAKAIVLPDPFENMGAQLLREAAFKANSAAGDGTTTATILAQALLHGSFRNLAAGADPISMCKGMRGGADAALSALRDMARPVNSREELTKVAEVSCEDDELGSIIGQAVYSVGLNGVVDVGDSGKLNTTVELQKGIVIERGFLSPMMATDSQQTVAELHSPYILLYDGRIENPRDLIPALTVAAENGRPCLIISDGLEPEAMGLIMENKLNGDLDIVCIEAPLYGDGRRWNMNDIAVQTGGVYIGGELGYGLKDVREELLGEADFVKVTRNRTIISGGHGDPAAISSRINQIKADIDGSDYEFNKKRYMERLARFVSGVAKIDVGGRTEVELQDRKLRVEDAVNAARAALEEGIVPGGGAALISVIPAVKEYMSSIDGDVKTGANILADALKMPLIQIAENAGYNGATAAYQLENENAGTGLDIETGKCVDMLAAGIADPLKVTRSALEAAVSIVSTLLTSEVGIAESNSDTKAGNDNDKR